ncbi:MAG: VCBS repeat-containing protein [Planctomycetaceae bacterium]|nr:VCBS repeat-containing protein [Planctomycetaceae bacterium]
MSNRKRKRRVSNSQVKDANSRPELAAGRSAWVRWWLGAGLGLIAVALGLFVIRQLGPEKAGQDPTPATPDPHLNEIGKVSVPAALELPVLPGLEEIRFDTVVRNVAEREDPTVDGWDSERFSELASAQLKSLGKMLIDPAECDDAHAAAVGATDFSSGGLRPSGLKSIFRDKTLEVLRPDDGANASEATTFRGPAGLVTLIKQQAAPLDDLTDQRFKFKIVRVELEGDLAKTRVYFQVSGRESKRAVQVNSKWTCDWQRGARKDDPPLLKSVLIEDYEEVVYRGLADSMFADCTESVFRNTDRFERQLVYGIDHWTDRFDGAIARPAAGHGIAVGDVNGDGLDDVYLCQSPALPNLLLLQNEDGSVTDIAPEAGVNWLEGTRAALLVDLDNDADQDLVAVLGGKVVIQANDGSGRFITKSIVDSVSSLFAINAVDYDGDKDLDLFICGYTLSSGADVNDVFANPMPFHDANNGAPNIMLRNDGGWAFTDVTEQIGFGENNRRFSYASAWEDFDNDGDLDVYVANDFGRNNLYRNDDGNFKDVAPEMDVEDIGPGMSSAWGDFNNDARPDLYVSNMFSSAGNRITHQQQFKTGLDDEQKKLFRRHARGNSLFENLGDKGFSDRSVDLGVTLGRWAWGSLFVDLNNDGWEDLYVANGFITADNNNDL